jgi:4-amino-4-deoxy-L-arabinose transferase-like glycosyltransferase
VQTIARSSIRSVIFLFAIALGTLFFRLGSLPLSGSDEPRYARIAQEMRAQDRWVTPILEGRPWLEKPPLYYWITIPMISLLGETEIAARMGPAISAFVAALAILWLGSRLWSRLAGLLGASILLTSIGFAGFGRAASTDMPMTACLTVALASLAVAAVDGKFSLWKILIGYGFLGLAILGKGPIALVLAAGIGLLFWCLDERGGNFGRWHVLPGLLVTTMISVPWFWLVFRENGFAFLATFLVNHNLARYVSDIHHHYQPFYYFGPVVLALFFPWSGFLVFLIPKSGLEPLSRWRSWNRGKLFLACWIILPLAFFSLSASKLAGYILPVLPPLALLVGERLSVWFSGHEMPFRWRGATWTYFVVIALMAVAAPPAFGRNYGGNWQIGLILSVVVAIPALFALRYGLRGNGVGTFKAVTLQGLLLVMAVAQFAFPVLGANLSAREIAGEALKRLQDDEPIITYRLFNHALSYYTGYRISGQLDGPESLAAFAEKHPRFLGVTEAANQSVVLDLPGCAVTILGSEGKLVLFEATRR